MKLFQPDPQIRDLLDRVRALSAEVLQLREQLREAAQRTEQTLALLRDMAQRNEGMAQRHEKELIAMRETFQARYRGLEEPGDLPRLDAGVRESLAGVSRGGEEPR